MRSPILVSDVFLFPSENDVHHSLPPTDDGINECLMIIICLLLFVTVCLPPLASSRFDLFDGPHNRGCILSHPNHPSVVSIIICDYFLPLLTYVMITYMITFVSYDIRYYRKWGWGYGGLGGGLGGGFGGGWGGGFGGGGWGR